MDGWGWYSLDPLCCHAERLDAGACGSPEDHEGTKVTKFLKENPKNLRVLRNFGSFVASRQLVHRGCAGCSLPDDG